jgi:hypothetical protein
VDRLIQHCAVADLCDLDVLCRPADHLPTGAQVLGEPLERISVEMVFRAFYHYSRAVQRGECDDLVAFLAEHATLLGIVKRQRKQHRERQELESIIWGDP